MEKELRMLEEGPQVEIGLDSHKAIFKKYPNGKHQAFMAYMDSG